MNGLAQKFRHYLHDRQGIAAIEFAVIAPILLLILSGAIDLGLALDEQSVLRNASRAGAQYATIAPTDVDGIKQVVVKATKYDSSVLTVSVSMTCKCSNGIAISCSNSCAANLSLQTYVTVEVSKAYTSYLPTAMMLGIRQISATATFRAG